MKSLVAFLKARRPSAGWFAASYVVTMVASCAWILGSNFIEFVGQYFRADLVNIVVWTTLGGVWLYALVIEPLRLKRKESQE